MFLQGLAEEPCDANHDGEVFALDVLAGDAYPDAERRAPGSGRRSSQSHRMMSGANQKAAATRLHRKPVTVTDRSVCSRPALVALSMTAMAAARSV